MLRAQRNLRARASIRDPVGQLPADLYPHMHAAVETTAVEACLHSSPAACPLPCAPQPRDCLTAKIPAWRRGVDFERVSCCFRGCLLGWIDRLGLRRNAAHWASRGASFFVHNGGGGGPRHAKPMPLDWMLNTRFAMGRFAHFLALDAKQLAGLNASTTDRTLCGEAYRVPHIGRRGDVTAATNGTLAVLNGWGHPPSLIGRIAASLPAHDAPMALVYGDDESWTTSQVRSFREAIEQPAAEGGGAPRRALAQLFAMNVAPDAAKLPFVRQIPIGLNGASSELPALLTAAQARGLQSASSHRSRTLLCCCQRAWPQRKAIFEALRAAGHTHCNLTEQRPYASLMSAYLRHRFVVSAFGHGRTDFREWEILIAGAVPVIQHFPEHDALLRGLPVLRVRDWTAVTPSFLDKQWHRLQREAKQGRVGLTKAYFPYWFAQFTAHMGEVRGGAGEGGGGGGGIGGGQARGPVCEEDETPHGGREVK
jgi:hypothetical protein